MAKGKKTSRVLIYSHDTFGLGHLRRCRTIAHGLVERYSDLSVLILTGSPIIGRFDFRARVDFVRIPGVIKLRNGEYQSLSLHMDIDATVALRALIIKNTADAFDPDMFIVDKEPLGLRGEVEPTLHLLKEQGTRLVLGVRDVLDDPATLTTEWERKRAVPAIQNFYNQVWVYGLPQIHKPLDHIELSQRAARKIVYTGYLPRTVPTAPSPRPRPELTDRPFILVTTGGGGDGAGLIDWVLRAYESGQKISHPAFLVLGPFMAPELRQEFFERAEKLDDVQAITFDSHIEQLEEQAVGIVAMGGYNTFCEILSLDKPAMIVPRTRPRQEQYIRAQRAESMGLVRMLVDPLEGLTEAEAGANRDPRIMARALTELPHQKRPSESVVPGLLDGIESVWRLTEPYLDPDRPTRRAPLKAIRGGAE